MNKTIIGIKELHKHLKGISEAARRGRSFLVFKNSRPVFRIEPVHEDMPKKYTRKDLKNLQVSGGSRTLSREIDTILYGEN